MKKQQALFFTLLISISFVLPILSSDEKISQKIETKKPKTIQVSQGKKNVPIKSVICTLSLLVVAGSLIALACLLDFHENKHITDPQTTTNADTSEKAGENSCP